MQAQVKLGRISGIAIGLHYSWFIIALLIVLSLVEHFHAVSPQWSDTLLWSTAIATGVLFFVTLLLQELAHSLLAKARGLRVREITLFALGGVSQIESEASDAKPGTQFEVEKAPISADIWLPTHFVMKSRAKILCFVKYNTEEDESYFYHHRPSSNGRVLPLN